MKRILTIASVLIALSFAAHAQAPTPATIAIRTPVLEQVMTYLTGQPYSQVASLIQQLQVDAQASIRADQQKQQQEPHPLAATHAPTAK